MIYRFDSFEIDTGRFELRESGAVRPVEPMVFDLICFLAGRPDFLDIALLYALVNFIGTLAVLKFVRYRTFGDAAEQDVPATPATVEAEKS